jgi:hypothetical protein
MEKIKQIITLKVNEDLEELKPHLRSWVEEHLIQPRRIVVFTDLDGITSKIFWLVTDHIGKEDSSYRVVYDEYEEVFGLEQILDTGNSWYMGPYGTFLQTIENM